MPAYVFSFFSYHFLLLVTLTNALYWYNNLFREILQHFSVLIY